MYRRFNFNGVREVVALDRQTLINREYRTDRCEPSETTEVNEPRRRPLETKPPLLTHDLVARARLRHSVSEADDVGANRPCPMNHRCDSARILLGGTRPSGTGKVPQHAQERVTVLGIRLEVIAFCPLVPGVNED